jgi:hypothetical protein
MSATTRIIYSKQAFMSTIFPSVTLHAQIFHKQRILQHYVHKASTVILQIIYCYFSSRDLSLTFLPFMYHVTENLGSYIYELPINMLVWLHIATQTRWMCPDAYNTC